MSEAEIRRAIAKRAAPGNAMSRYLKCENLIRILANKKFESEAALMKFMLQ